MKEAIGRSSRRYWIVTVLIFTLLMSVSLVSIALAAQTENTITVNWPGDEKKSNDGHCTLREAIISANQNSASGNRLGECIAGSSSQLDVISIPPGVYILERTDNGAENSSNTGDQDILDNLVVRGQPSALDPDNPQPIVITGKRITDRVFHVLNGSVTLENLTIRDGSAKYDGGGVLNDGANLKLLNVTLTGNHAAGNGGGLANAAGTTTLSYVTIAGNTNAAGNGSGLLNLGGAANLVVHSTIVDGDSCNGPMTKAGANMASHSSCTAISTISGSPQLGAAVQMLDAANNPWDAYFPLEAGSPAINAAVNVPPNLICPAKDQIDFARPQSACDLGAIESEAVNLPPVAGTKVVVVAEDSTVADAPNTFNLSGVAYDPENVPLVLTAVGIPTESGGTTAIGTATITNATTLEIAFVPFPNFNGDGSFSYTVCDDIQCTDGTVELTVTADQWIEVTNTADSGTGSLRDAISLASGDLTKTIIFLIEDGNNNYCDAATITPASPLIIDGPVNIDGIQLPDGACASTPHITIAGSSSAFDGLKILAAANGSTVSGLAIDGFGENGIYIEGTGEAESGNGNTIANNTISGNGANGVLLGSPSAGADSNIVEYNTIVDNCGSGVLIYGLTVPYDAPSAGDITGNTVRDNTISGNGWCVQPPDSELNDGVTVVKGLNNEIVDNNIFNNAGLGIDLGGDGPTGNDQEDPDGGANYTQNYPDVKVAIVNGTVGGYLNSVPSRLYTLQFWTTASCDNGIPGTAAPLAFTYLESDQVDVVTGADGNKYVQTDSDGNGVFALNVDSPDLSSGEFVFASAIDPDGNTSEYSPCVRIEDENITWFWARLEELNPQAQTVQSLNSINALNPANFDAFATVDDQGITDFGQSKWYLLKDVKPDSTLTIELSNLPANYDLLLYTDIMGAWTDIVNADPDLDFLSASDPTDMFAAPAWAAPAWAAPAWADTSLADDELAAPAWAPETLAAPAWAASSYAAPAWAAPAWAAPAWADNPVLATEAYAGAQTASLVAVSALDGLASERIVFHTFDYSGDFYIRVGGRNGAFNPTSAYRLDVGLTYGQCQALNSDKFEVDPTGLTIDSGGYETLILWDQARMLAQYPEDEYPGQVTALESKLQALAAVSGGKVIDVNADGQVQAANAVADANPGCVSTKNVVAESVREIIKAYRVANPGIKYLLFIGNDGAIPDFRHSDVANLGPESDYRPPVESDPLTASFAQLGKNYFLSLDKYGATIDDAKILAYKGDELPLLEIAPARLVETPTEIMTVIQAYLDLGAPYTMTLDSSDFAASVGYDFMKDTAEAISDVLSGSGAYPSSVPGLTVQELIGDSWTADDMRGILYNTSADPTVAYFGGHYSANRGVAADYESEFYPADVINSPQDFANNVFFGNGCHMGYNIVDQDNDYDQNNVLITEQPDWAQAFASRGATLIAGTGYQYGDTDFIEYNEQIYLALAKALRNGNNGGPISIGDAFVQAKNEYLNNVPVVRGIHQKSLMQTTIYGLPMLKFDLPGSAVQETNNPSIFNSTNTPSEVGGTHPLNLHSYDLVRDYVNAGSPNYVGPLTEQPVTLTNIDTGGQVSAPYLVGPPPLGLLQNNIGEPILPRDAVNVTVPGSNLVLRGVGFRGGEYTDYKRGADQDQATWKYTLTGLAATELGGAHFDFLSNIFYPSLPWNVNRFDALTASDGNTILNFLPAQYYAPLPTPPDTTLRQYKNLAAKLYFSDWTAQVGDDLPALASAPAILKVEGLTQPDGSVTFNVWVVGDPTAGVEDVWITRTVLAEPTLTGTPGAWVSDDLVQSGTDSSLWSLTVPAADFNLPPGTDLSDVRFMAQACTGTGVCALNDNFGRHFIPGVNDLTETAVTLSGSVNVGAVGQDISFSATLVDATTNQPLNDLPIYFNLGSQTRFAVVQNGTAQVSIPLLSAPGDYNVNAIFPGNALYAQSAATPLDFTITKQNTVIEWVPNNQPLFTDDSGDIIVLLKDVDGNILPEKSVLFKLQSPVQTIYKSVITDQEGLARLGNVVLVGAPIYTVSAEFAGTASYNGSSTQATSTLSAVEVVALETNSDGSTTVVPSIWPTNNKPITIEVRQADGNHTPLSYPYRFDLIEQDERVKQGPDAAIENGCSTAWVLAERDGNGNGRVYRVSFTVLYPGGIELPGVGYIATIPHDQSGDSLSIDDGPTNGYYTSATCQP